MTKSSGPAIWTLYSYLPNGARLHATSSGGVGSDSLNNPEKIYLAPGSVAAT